MRSLFGRRDSSTSSSQDYHGSGGKASAIKITGGTSPSTSGSIPINYDALLMALEVLAESFDLLSPIPRISRMSKFSDEAINMSTRLQNMSIRKYELEDVEEIDTIW